MPAPQIAVTNGWAWQSLVLEEEQKASIRAQRRIVLNLALRFSGGGTSSQRASFRRLSRLQSLRGAVSPQTRLRPDETRSGFRRNTFGTAWRLTSEGLELGTPLA